MIKIKNFNNIIATLYDKDDNIIGNFNSHEQLMDIQIQIFINKFEGYYFKYLDYLGNTHLIKFKNNGDYIDKQPNDLTVTFGKLFSINAKIKKLNNLTKKDLLVEYNKLLKNYNLI